MKACPACGRLYPDDAGFCPVDGSQLLDAQQVPVAASADDARVGQVLCGRYQVRRVVADGGMGRVYEALDLNSQRHVALKVLHPEVALDTVAVERFRREFEVSDQLPHSHIVEVLDFQSTHDNSYALAMEFLYGEELRNTLKRESVIPPERVVRMVSQVAVALDEAHTRKLVHRDLKPENIFLCQTNEGDISKILDFGSVKDKAEDAKKLTVMGTTIGSPFYMSPEQAQGLDTLDHRADVWALAAITYECVTGQIPFKGNNGPSILLEILTKDPEPPSEASTGQKYPVPATLDQVMAKALKKKAAERIATVGAFADSVGTAYGLEGSHADWARTPQYQLANQIAAKLGRLMEGEGPPSAAARVAAAMGVGTGLQIMNDPFAVPGAAAPGAMPPAAAPMGPAPVGSAPMGQYPAPMGQYPAPMGQYPAPMAPAPMGQYPAPTAPAPVAPAPMGQYPAPMGQYPAPMGQAPMGQYAARDEGVPLKVPTSGIGLLVGVVVGVMTVVIAIIIILVVVAL